MGALSYIQQPNPGINWEPGQYFEFNMGKWKLPLACASSPGSGTIDFVHTRSDIDPNAGCEGPYGTSFPMHLADWGRKIYLIGGGTGYSSLRSVGQALERHDVDVHLIYSAKTVASLPYVQEMVGLAADPNHEISLTGEEDRRFSRGRVTTHLPESFEDDDLIYICGPARLTEAVMQDVLRRGASSDMVYVSLPMKASDGGPVLCLSGNENKINAFIEKWKKWG